MAAPLYPAPPSRRNRPVTDPFGYDAEFHQQVRPALEFLYRRYWRVRTDGIDHVPASGPVLVVGNHSGGIPFDAAMLAMALEIEQPGSPRLLRFLYDRFVADMPLVGTAYNRFGAVLASYANGCALLERGDVVGLFPEGVAGVAKGIGQRYRLQPFHTGFIRMSLTYRVPIVPVVVVGAEEIYPVVGKLKPTGAIKALLNVPYVPVTPFFPLFGPLGAIPLPSKWHIRFGKPIELYRDPRWQPDHRKQVRQLAEGVRRQLQEMIHTLLAERESMF